MRQGWILNRGKRSVSSPECPEQVSGQLSLQLCGYQSHLPGCKAASVWMTTPMTRSYGSTHLICHGTGKTLLVTFYLHTRCTMAAAAAFATATAAVTTTTAVATATTTTTTTTTAVTTINITTTNNTTFTPSSSSHFYLHKFWSSSVPNIQHSHYLLHSLYTSHFHFLCMQGHLTSSADMLYVTALLW